MHPLTYPSALDTFHWLYKFPQAIHESVLQKHETINIDHVKVLSSISPSVYCGCVKAAGSMSEFDDRHLSTICATYSLYLLLNNTITGVRRAIAPMFDFECARCTYCIFTDSLLLCSDYYRRSSSGLVLSQEKCSLLAANQLIHCFVLRSPDPLSLSVQVSVRFS